MRSGIFTLPFGEQTRQGVAAQVDGAIETDFACLAAAWLEADGLEPSCAHHASLAVLPQRSLCARDVLGLLGQSARGRKALHDLGLQPFLHDVQGE